MMLEMAKGSPIEFENYLSDFINEITKAIVEYHLPPLLDILSEFISLFFI